MLTRIITDSVSTISKVMSGKLQSYGLNGLLIGILVGGSGHAEANFDGHVLNVTLRQRKGENKQLINGCRITDLLKYSDYKAGFSLQTKGVATGRYVAYIPLGRVRLEDDDQLEVSLSCALHATATYGYTICGANLQTGPEDLIGYELVTGNGNELPIKDVYALYGLSAASGASVSVGDHEGSYTIVDTDAMDLSNALGMLEVYEDFSVLYTDKYGVSQDIRAKLPNATYALAVKGFFDQERLAERSDSEGVDVDSVTRKIGVSKPEKVSVLRALGKIA